MRELAIIEKQEEKKILYIEDYILKEYYIESKEKKRLEGNIYIGRVTDILPGMQAAFVDIGEEKNAFLHLQDILPKKSNVTGNKQEDIEKYKIKDYIKQNEMILVQVKKDSNSVKGAKVSTNIQIPGRFVVILPENNFITVSQKIENEEEKNRLIEIAKKVRKDENIGIIIRTAAEGKNEEEIKNDIKNCIKDFNKITNEFKKEKQKNTAKILRSRDTILYKVLLDIVDNNLDRIIVNTDKEKTEIAKILSEINYISNIEIVCKKEIESIYDLDKQIEKIKSRKIWLKCGGFITIDKTEALTAIDVNTRKIYRKRKLRKYSCKS